MALNRTTGEDKTFDKTAKIIEMLENIFRTMESKWNRLGLSVSLPELTEDYTEVVENIIIKEEEEKKSEYVGGEFKISCPDDEHYECSYSLYFRNPDNTFYVLEAHSDKLDTKYLTEDFRDELQKEKKIKFDIDPPSEEAKAKYKVTKNADSSTEKNDTETKKISSPVKADEQETPKEKVEEKLPESENQN